MKTGDIVKFAKPENETEADIRMKILENNGDRCLVEVLIGHMINPTCIFPTVELEAA